MSYAESFAADVFGPDCDSMAQKTRISGHPSRWNVIVERFRPLWNALCWLQDEDYPLTGDQMHTRWCLGLW